MLAEFERDPVSGTTCCEIPLFSGVETATSAGSIDWVGTPGGSPCESLFVMCSVPVVYLVCATGPHRES